MQRDVRRNTFSESLRTMSDPVELLREILDGQREVAYVSDVYERSEDYDSSTYVVPQRVALPDSDLEQRLEDCSPEMAFALGKIVAQYNYHVGDDE